VAREGYFRQRSLKFRLALVTLATFLIGIWTISFYASGLMRAEMMEQLGVQQLASVGLVAEQIDSEVTVRLRGLERVSATFSAAMIADPASAQHNLQYRPVIQALFNGGTRLCALDGSVIATVPLTPERMAANYADRDYFQEAIRTGKSVIGKPVIGKVLGQPAIGMATPVRDGAGQIIAVLIGAINLAEPTFFDRVSGHKYGQTGSYLLVDPKNRLFITATDPTRVLQPLPAPGINAMHDRYMAGHEDYGVAMNSRGIEELSAAKYIPSAGWFVVGILPTAEAFAPIRILQLRLVIVALLLSLIAGGLIWWATSTLLRKQLAPMLEASRLLGHLRPGDPLPKRLPVQTHDEVGELIGSFNHVITVVSHHQAELQQYQDHLEQMVETRTHELEVAKDAAEAASRAKSTFLANMSHELRTPMNAIMGLTGLVLRRTEDPKLRDQLGKIDQASKHLLSVINDILDLAKIEAERLTLEHAPFSLGQVLGNVHSMVANKAGEKRLAIHLDLPPGLPGEVCVGDPLRLGQILLNLTGNAIKFTERGTITLRAAVQEETATDRLLRWEVEDTGIGISPADQPRLFTPFEQVDGSMTRKHGGTGLGLSICKRLVEMMGGEIGVDSAPGRGAKFWFTVRLGLPAASAVATPQVTAGAIPSAPTFHGDKAMAALQQCCAGRRILLVEDEPINLEVSRGLLEDAGLWVDVAEDGEQALAAARRNVYALILMDMQMPNMNGIEATRAICADSLNTTTPILAMTANAFVEDRQACIDAGMRDHITKPVAPVVLYETLLKWLQPPAAPVQ